MRINSDAQKRFISTVNNCFIRGAMLGSFASMPVVGFPQTCPRNIHPEYKEVCAFIDENPGNATFSVIYGAVPGLLGGGFIGGTVSILAQAFGLNKKRLERFLDKNPELKIKYGALVEDLYKIEKYNPKFANEQDKELTNWFKSSSLLIEKAKKGMSSKANAVHEQLTQSSAGNLSSQSGELSLEQEFNQAQQMSSLGIQIEELFKILLPNTDTHKDQIACLTILRLMSPENRDRALAKVVEEFLTPDGQDLTLRENLKLRELQELENHWKSIGLIE